MKIENLEFLGYYCESKVRRGIRRYFQNVRRGSTTFPLRQLSWRVLFVKKRRFRSLFIALSIFTVRISGFDGFDLL